MQQHHRMFLPGTMCLVFFVLSGCQSAGGDKKINSEYAGKGEILFVNYGCKACHSLEGENMYGPALDSILGRQVRVIRHGQSLVVTIDRDYIMRSLQDPGYEKVDGFQSRTMPKPDISSREMESLVEYLVLVNKENSK